MQNLGLEEKIARFQARFEDAQKQDLYFFHRSLEEIQGSWGKVDGRPILLLSSYSYLGIHQDPRIQEAAQKAWMTYGVGSHGSPILAGTTKLHMQLQEELSDFVGCEETMLFSSGYVANVATISTLCGPEDYVFVDKLNHASIIDGCSLSGANMRRFKHNDVAHLERLLFEAPASKTKLVIVDAVFSMDGDIANLPQISAICRRYGAILMVDEAHSLGVLGERGSGIEEYFDMPGVIDIKMGVLSKSIPCTGAYVGGNKALITYLRHHSRGYIFSGAILPSVVASARASLKIIRDEPWRVSRLRMLSQYLRDELAQRGVIAHSGFQSEVNECRDGFSSRSQILSGVTPVVPVITGEQETTLEIVREIQKDGVLLFSVLPPAVPPKTCRLRLCANAAMTEKDIRFAADVVARHVQTSEKEVAYAI